MEIGCKQKLWETTKHKKPGRSTQAELKNG